MEEKELNELWKIAVTIHQYLKEVVIQAEEFDKEFMAFLQPSTERQHALDHIIRSEAARLGINQNHNNPEYIKKQLEIAIGHLYRGFFDASDWFSVIIRARIGESLKNYSHACINAAIPDYYNKLRPQTDSITKNIAFLRDQKDIQKGVAELLKEVEKYRKELDDLMQIYQEIAQKIPGLQDYQERERKEKQKDKTFQILLVVGSVVLTYIFCKFS